MTGKGAWLGAKTGFLLAACYAPIAVLLQVLNSRLGSNITGVLIIGSVIGVFVGGIPAALVGTLIGSLIGVQLGRLKKKPGQKQAVWIGLGIAGGIVLLINGCFADLADIIFGPTYSDRNYIYWFSSLQNYAVFLALPSLICVPAGGWMGRRLAAKWPGNSGSQSFAHLAPNSQLDLATFIRQQHPNSYRYEIDLALLRQGYSAEQIEEEWRKLQQLPRPRLPLGQLWQLVFAYWLVLALVGSGLLLVGWRLW